MADRRPPELTELKGNPGNRPTSTKAKSKTGRPTPPADLTGEAFAEWCRITTFLEKVGRIETVDYAALVVYCSAWAMFDQARRHLENQGPVVVGRDGGFVRNPAAQVMNDASKMMLSYGGKFGFTPRDRINLGIGSDPDEGNSLERDLQAL